MKNSGAIPMAAVIIFFAIGALIACDDSSEDTAAERQRANTSSEDEESGQEESGEQESAAQRRDEPKERLVEFGAFSYLPPESWTVQEIPGLKYAAAIGPEKGGIAANLNVVSDRSPDSLDDYFETSLTEMELMFQDFELHGRREFSSQQGAAIQFDISHVQHGTPYRQRMYIFQVPDHPLYLLTCTLHSDLHDQEEILELCDGSAKSFRVEER